MITERRLNKLRRGDRLFFRCKQRGHRNSDRRSGVLHVAYVDLLKDVGVGPMEDDVCCSFYYDVELYLTRGDWLKAALEGER